MSPDHPLIRTIVVDDEPLARERMRTLLRAEDDVHVIAECGNGREAVRAITDLHPDLVMLDVQLPELDGFAVLEAIATPPDFDVIFVTAHDENAVQAFEVNACDYLLKPCDAERLRHAIQRVRDRRTTMAAPRPAPEEPMPHPPGWDRLAVREHNRVIFLKPAEIDWIEAEGNYVRLHLNGKAYLLRETMHAAEQRLTARGFLRISRSALVNLERVREMQPLFHGDAVLVLHDGRQLSVTRAYRTQLDNLLAQSR